MANCVEDVRLLDAVMSGTTTFDATMQDENHASVSAPTVLYVPRLGTAPCAPEIIAAADACAHRLEQLGCHVQQAALPLDLAPLDSLWPCIAEQGLAQLFATHPQVAASATPRYRAMAARGCDASSASPAVIQATVDKIRRSARRLFLKNDVVLMPTAAAMPWTADQPWPERIDRVPVGPRGHAIYTGWVNAAGLPALAIPAPVPDESLPIGVQLIGNVGSERYLLALGKRLLYSGDQ